MSPTFHFYLRSRLIGSAEVQEPSHKRISGVAFFCPECADVWALIRASGRRTFTVHKYCDKHPRDLQMGGPPGALYLPWEPELFAAFPPVLLKREFSLCLDFYMEQS